MFFPQAKRSGKFSENGKVWRLKDYGEAQAPQQAIFTALRHSGRYLYLCTIDLDYGMAVNTFISRKPGSMKESVILMRGFKSCMKTTLFCIASKSGRDVRELV